MQMNGIPTFVHRPMFQATVVCLGTRQPTNWPKLGHRSVELLSTKFERKDYSPAQDLYNYSVVFQLCLLLLLYFEKVSALRLILVGFGNQVLITVVIAPVPVNCL